jgi:hypothetical protein
MEIIATDPEPEIVPTPTATTPPIAENGGAQRQSPKKILGFLIPLVLIISLVGIVFVGYRLIFKNPKKAVVESFSRLVNSNSISFSYTADGDKLTIYGDIHKNTTNPSKIDLNYSFLDGGKENKVEGHAIYNNKDIFLSIYYDDMQEFEKQVVAFSPNLRVSRTYYLTKPFLFDRKWLDINFASLRSNFPQSPSEGILPPQTNKDETVSKKIADLAYNAVVVKKYNRLYLKDKKIYQKATLGFDKEKLVILIESLKDTNIDIKVSQINSAIQLVKSTDGWDEDLVEVLIDANNNISQLSLSFPAISEDALTQGVEEGLGKSSQLKSLYSFLPALFKNQNKSGELLHIGTVNFRNFDNAPTAELPRDYISFNEIVTAAKVEIVPMVAQMFGGGSSSTTQNNLPYQPKSALEYSQMMEAQKKAAQKPTPPVNQ